MKKTCRDFREETGVPVLCDVSPTGFSSAPAEHYDFGILTAFFSSKKHISYPYTEI